MNLPVDITLDTYLVILPIVFFAGLVDSVAGGGGLISLPAYLIAGLPPHIALANNKMSSCFGTLVSTLRYFRHGMIDIKIAVPAAIFALIGSNIGTMVVVMIEPFFLNYLLVILLPIIIIFVYSNKSFGDKNTSIDIQNKQKQIIASVAGLILGFYDGFFGPGMGAFLILFFTLILKYDFTIANGNTKVVNLASNIASLVTFVLYGKVIFSLGVAAAIAGIAGNLLGSKIVIKKGNKIIRPIFLCVCLLLFAKVVWDMIF
jgi:uncharacterized membrane protein YfcA